MRGLTFRYVRALICASGACLSFLATSPMAYSAGDQTVRGVQRGGLADPSNDASVVECLRNGLRRGITPDPRILIRANRAALDLGAGRVFLAKDHRPPSPELLEQIPDHWRAGAEWWHNPAARELIGGDQFVTRNGEHRWTKVIAGSKEVWRGPDGLLIADVIERMTHFDAQRIDRALARLYAHAIQENGQWKWPEGFDPAAFLRQEMSRRVNAKDLPSGDSHNNGSHDVAPFFDPLMESIGRILEPDVPWRLPIQQGSGIENPGPTREWSILRNQGVLEVFNDTSNRWFWSSSVHADISSLAHTLNGSYGYIDSADRGLAWVLVRVVARRR